jgi:hypothetical protein
VRFFFTDRNGEINDLAVAIGEEEPHCCLLGL